MKYQLSATTRGLKRACSSVLWMSLAGLFACSDSRPKPTPTEQLNVLLITLDTTRADRIGCYGHEAAETPAIDSLAQRGIRFESAYSQAALTLPSHVSMLTGTYPKVNGIRVNARGRMSEATPSMAQVFHDRGYQTGGFTSIMVLHGNYGLDLGFDVYDNPVRQNDIHSPNRGRTARSAGETCDRALAWLKRAQTRPFFAWVHFFDPHLPLNPPSPFDTRLEDPYDGEIAYADSQVARLLSWLDETGLRERTLIIVTADHGEALGEHGEDEHGFFIYSSTTHVPLVLSAPKKLPVGIVVENTVALVSLLPTVLEILEWDVDFEMNGKSFADSWRLPDWQSRPSYSESEYPRLGYGWSAIQSIVTDDWMFVESPRPELYDRRTDRGELVNLADERPEVALRMGEQLAELIDAMEPRELASTHSSSAEQAALEGIGYVQTTPSEFAPETGRDPKDMVTVSNRYLHTLRLVRSNKHEEARIILEQLVQESPESDAIHASLANAYMKLNKPAQAEREYRMGLRTDPNNAGQLFLLASALLEQNKLDEAAQAFGTTLAADPGYGQAHGQLGVLAAKKGDLNSAREHFRSFVRISPTSTSALCNLASAQMQFGEWREAIGGLKQALNLDPNCIQAHFALWQAVRAGKFTRSGAIGELRKSLASSPANDELAARLAWALATDPKGDVSARIEALTLAQRRTISKPNDWFGHDALSVAFASNNDFPNAIAASRRALELSRTRKSPASGQIERRLGLFLKGNPYFE